MAESMSKADRIALFSRILTEAGYVPQAEEGQVRFKHEGGLYLVMVFDDQSYLSVVYPRFWPFKTEAELARAEKAACVATVKTKAAKVLIADGNNVSAAVELFCSPPRNFEPVLALALLSLKHAVKCFRAEVDAA
jgi:hypothetical protein